MKPHEADSLATIEKWFSGKCDGLWEHQKGLALTTTDNPGWLMTVDEPLDEPVFDKVITDVRERWGAECIREPDKTKVFAGSLQNCICAVAQLLAARASHKQKL